MIDIFNKKRVKKLEECINDIRNNRDYYEKLYISQVEHTNSLVKDNTYLKEANTKLMDWVYKILKEFGTSEVKEDHITIPICKKIYDRPIFEGEDCQGYIERERIDIPAITIIKMR